MINHSSTPILFRLWIDDINLYIAAKVRTKLLAKIVIGFFTLFFALPGPIILLQGGGSAVPTAAFALLVWAVAVGKLALWNLFGTELLIINTKSVSYQRSYGIFQTNLRTYSFQHLRITPRVIREEDNSTYYKLQFYNYNENNLPELLIESSIPLPEQHIVEVFEQLNTLFAPETGFPPLSLN